MARKRMIDPNIWNSEDFSKLSVLARLLFIGLFSNADDEGRGKGKAVYLKSIIFPYDETMRVSDVEKALGEIASYMSVVFYEAENNEYYELTSFHKWQKVDKPRASLIPKFGESSPTVRGTFPPNRIEEKRKETKQKGKEARAYGENQNVVLTDGELEKLIAVCGSAAQRSEYIERLSGWLSQIGETRAKNYASHFATIQNWVRRDSDRQPQSGKQSRYDTDESYKSYIEKVKEFTRKRNEQKALLEKGFKEEDPVDGGDGGAPA